MPFSIGLGLALAVAAFARLTGFDRDRAFYPVVLIVVAALYVLFAVIAGANWVLELVGFLVFAAAAVIAFRTTLWIVAAGLVLHGLFDLTRPAFLPDSGAPGWWPAFCAGYDIAAGAILAAMLLLDRNRAARQR